MIVLICVVCLRAGVFAEDETLVFECPSGNFCVALDGLPEDIDSAVLYRLFLFLEENVKKNVDSELAGYVDHYPVVLRFVGAQVVGRFPRSAETYGGMIGLARWACDRSEIPAGGALIHCAVWALDEQCEETPNVIIAIITTTEDRNENLGLAAHELAHVFGAIDGPRCPSNEDYLPGSVTEPDASDSYWWYGVTGVFSLRPAGIVWEALGDRCALSQAPEWCAELRQILTVEPISR